MSGIGNSDSCDSKESILKHELRPSDSKSNPSPVKITAGKFRKSGMMAGALEQYLVRPPPVPSSLNLSRAESPEIEIIYDSTADESSLNLEMRNPEEIFSTPDIKMSRSPEPEIEYLGCFGGNGATKIPLHVSCRKNLTFKSDLDERTSSNGSSVSVDYRINETGEPTAEQECAVLTQHSFNLLAVSEDMAKNDAPSAESEDEIDVEVRSSLKRKTKFKLVTPAEHKRIVTAEEKENEIDMQSLENCPVEVSANPERSLITEKENSTTILSLSLEKKRENAEKINVNGKPKQSVGRISASQGNSPSNLAREASQSRVTSPLGDNSRVLPRQSYAKQVDLLESSKMSAVFGTLRSIRVNIPEIRPGEAVRLPSSEVTENYPKDDENISYSVEEEATAEKGNSEPVSLNSLYGTKFISHIEGTALNRPANLHFEGAEAERNHEAKKLWAKNTEKRKLQDTVGQGSPSQVNLDGKVKKKRKIEAQVLTKESSESDTNSGIKRTKKTLKHNLCTCDDSRKAYLNSVVTTETGNVSTAAHGNYGSKFLHNNHNNQMQKLNISNPEYAKLWEKKLYKEALMKLSQNIQEEKFPSQVFTTEIIITCVLRLSPGRITKEVRSLANEVFQQLIEKPLVRTYFWEVFDSVKEDLKSQNHRVIDLLLMHMREELQLKCDEKDKLALRFFKSLTLLCEKDYKLYQSQFKIRQPLFVQLMMDQEQSGSFGADYNGNWSRLLQYVKVFAPDKEEAQVLIKWIDLLACHYMDKGVKQLLEDGVERLKEDLVTNIIQRKDNDYGFRIVSMLRKGDFSREVSRTLFCDYLPKLENPVQNWTNILLELSVHLPDRRASPQQLTNHRAFELSSDGAAFYKFVTAKVNVKGESNVHIVCTGKKRSYGSGNSKLEYDAKKLLHQIKTKKIGDINITDNNGNTPLHEAAYHGKVDVIQNIWEYFTDSNQPPGPFKVDILAQNGIGQTALHLAVMQKQPDAVGILLTMASYCGCLRELLRIRTNTKKIAMDLLSLQYDPVSNEIRTLIQKHDQTIFNRKHFGGVKFPEETISLIESDKKLQAFLFYWRDLYKAVPKDILSNDT